MAQQQMGRPTVATQKLINQMVRRARQFADLEIVIRSIPVTNLTLMAHTDAAFANATREGTQGGYVIAAVDRAVMNDSE
eukprot:358041-Pyramimonas_sp.AAC.1